MLKDREKLYQVYHTLLSLAVTWAMALIMNQYLGLRTHIALTAVFTFVPTVLIYIFILIKNNIFKYAVLITVIPILALVFWIKKFNPIIHIRNFVKWCFVYNGSDELYVRPYTYFAVFGLAIVGALLFYFFTKNQSFKLLLAIIIIVAAVYYSVNKTNVNKVVVCIGIFYILAIIVELSGSIYSKKEGRQEKKEGILYLAPICILLAVISIALPSKATPIQWTGVKLAYHSIIEQFESWSTDLNYFLGKSDSEFFIGLSGYSEDGGKLNSKGTKIAKDGKVALKVTGLNNQESTYLIGSICNNYTGYSWEKGKDTYLSGEEEYFLDFAEFYSALSRQKMDVLKNNSFFKKTRIRVKYDNIKTKSFFYPLKTSNYSLFTMDKKLSIESAQITFNKGKGKGTSYYCEYYEMNLQGDAFRQMLREADSFSYDRGEDVNTENAMWVMKSLLHQDNSDKIEAEEDLYGLLGERANMINAKYTALPEELPDRVRELAIKITAKSDTNYDKLKAIEAYLMNYTYTLSPKAVPKGQDFIDYFLFESRTGYCTSFATAMAVLSRCIGIPSRYVEGFIADFDKKGADGYYAVKNSQAHAWAEVYIEGVGWIPFEATPSFFDNRYSEWAETSENNTTANSVSVQASDFYDEIQAQNNTPVTHTSVEKKKVNYDQIKNAILMVLTVLLSVCFLIIIYYQVLKYQYRKTFKRADFTTKMYMLFLRILQLLKREGFPLEQQETILMFSKRVEGRFRYGSISFSVVADIFMRYRYAQAEVAMAEFEKVNFYYDGLKDKKKAEERFIKLWLEEFLFLAKGKYR